ncbi:sulfate/molybdate ABC transporter ATP-binding protein [Nakamurella endophytica]|uniref:ABC transporter ATP-binding protein n=1 Tax=Nakamurella endophytica TaxID=1748367 RepID=A0A917WC29_9ACTN|nr:ABC transporter ATP-binding protein [Nakamurella endophytica]GGL88799.1 ABC transporter ATP-binding protein [Nakamurella endophytica]
MSAGTVPLAARIRVDRPAFEVAVELDVPAGTVAAVVGPNGAGKSTVLQVLAGLERPASGEIRLGERLLTRRSPGAPEVHVPVEGRRVGLLGQRPMLFPHLSAADNVAFGPRAQGVDRRTAARDARDWLDRLGLADLAGRRPQRLSGGQAQRVALARALAARPDLLLLDEPLAALDARTAPEVRQVLRGHLRSAGTTAVLVTHDVLDAAVLADQVLVLDRGAVVDSGPAAEVLAMPRSAFGAALAGVDLIRGTVDAPARDGELVRLTTTTGRTVTGIAVGAVAAGEAGAVFPPSAVAVHVRTDEGSARNRWPAVVAAMESVGAAVRLWTAGPNAVAADVTPAAVAELDLAPGRPVELSVKATEVRVHQR